MSVQKIQHLESQLVNLDNGPGADLSKKIDLLNELAWALSDIDLTRAQSLSESAQALAEAATDNAPSYRIGLGYSLRTQGYVNMRLGHHSLGLSQLLKAQEIFETLRFDAGLADVLDHIAGIYYQIGNFSEALSCMQSQLETAQRLDDKRLIANAYNNISNIYFETGNYERAIEILDNNLQLAIEIDYPRIECLSYLNLAETHSLAGNYRQALTNSQQALTVSRAAGFQLFEVYALDFIGKSYLKLDEAVRAIDHLKQALALSQKIGSNVTESLSLLNLGQAYLNMGQLELALAYGQQSLATAQAIDAKNELVKGHLLLSKIYEQQGDLAQALHHFKQHHAYNEIVFGQETDERLKVLQVAHDTAAARIEARFLQQQTDELQREVSERIRAEAQVQRQLNYTRALAACSQRLLQVTGSEADNRQALVEALQHLLESTQASKIFLVENFDDPELGFSSRFVLDVCAPGVPSGANSPGSAVIPWSVAPTQNRERLEAGEPVGGPVKTLFATTPSFRDYLLDEDILSVQFFPIHFGECWWGYIGFDDRVAERVWSEEEILLLKTAAEMLSSTLQRWQAEKLLRQTNDRLEQQVKARTSELTNIVTLLQKQIKERQRAEAEIQQIVQTLEQRVATRTDELATFFDLTLLAGQAATLSDVFEQALPRILEVMQSRVICLHLFDAAGPILSLAAQHSLPLPAHTHLQRVPIPPDFLAWLEQPHDPLITDALPSFTLLPPPFRLPHSQSYLGAQVKVGQQVLGLLSCYRFTARGFGLDEISLMVALAEQLGMVLETHRLRQHAREIAVIEERQRLARDLHDSVSQSLYSLSILSRVGREAIEDSDTERLADSLANIERNTRHALREMRLLLYELRPADLEQEGLKKAILLRLSTVEQRVGLQLAVQIDEFPEMSPDCEIELYHIIVETLNNVVKHAAANRLTLHLTRAAGSLNLLLADDGLGFDPTQTTGGLGLRNIRERVARLDGQLSITSRPGRGTRLEATIPYRKEQLK